MSDQTTNSSAWRTIVPQDQQDVYAAAGFGAPAGLGSRPALLIIDVQYRTVGLEPLPVQESIERYYRTSCGQAGWDAIARIAPLADLARRQGVPVVYPYVAPKGKLDAGRTGAKIPSLMEVDARGYDFPTEVAPQDGDLLIPKRHPSAFFGTALVSHLIDLGVDTVILTGATTSGCVRCSAVDAFAYNFHCAVVEDAVYDRAQMPHDMSLFDLASKYADVITSETAADYLRGLER